MPMWMIPVMGKRDEAGELQRLSGYVLAEAPMSHQAVNIAEGSGYVATGQILEPLAVLGAAREVEPALNDGRRNPAHGTPPGEAKCTTTGCPGVLDHVGPCLPEMENPCPV